MLNSLVSVVPRTSCESLHPAITAHAFAPCPLHAFDAPMPTVKLDDPPSAGHGVLCAPGGFVLTPYRHCCIGRPPLVSVTPTLMSELYHPVAGPVIVELHFCCITHHWTASHLLSGVSVHWLRPQPVS